MVVGACIAISAASSVAFSASAEKVDSPPQVASVVWDDRPETSAELAADSTSLVEARVTGVEAGPDLNDPLNDPDTAIPTQRITFETVDVLDGQIPETFRLFKTGSADVHLQGDPLYEVGESYVLFLEPQGEPGTYIPVAPDGRLELDAQHEADPVIGGPVGQELDGLTPAEIAHEVGQ